MVSQLHRPNASPHDTSIVKSLRQNIGAFKEVSGIEDPRLRHSLPDIFVAQSSVFRPIRHDEQRVGMVHRAVQALDESPASTIALRELPADRGP